MSLNAQLKKTFGSTVVALNGVTAGSIAAGPTLSLAQVNDPEWESIVANVSAALTTSTITATTRWEVSNNGSTFVPLYGLNAAANVTVAPAGSGSLVTTAWAQAVPVNVSFPYVRLSVVVGVVTGGAGDNVTISYNYRRRGFVA